MLTRENTIKMAIGYVDQGFLCSESVLMAIRDALQASCLCIPRVATGFAAGLGRTGNLCGAFSGAVMGLGLELGRDQPTGGDRPPHWFAKKMAEAFEGDVGSLTCPGILGIDIVDPIGYRTYKDRNMWETVCKDLIIKAVGLAYDILAEEKIVKRTVHTGA
jgi:C_GCAxxG_C_C family probable redox protein